LDEPTSSIFQVRSPLSAVLNFLVVILVRQTGRDRETDMAKLTGAFGKFLLQTPRRKD
jgi:hypothetical protein